jgi:hypothetical protein
LLLFHYRGKTKRIFIKKKVFTMGTFSKESSPHHQPTAAFIAASQQQQRQEHEANLNELNCRLDIEDGASVDEKAIEFTVAYPTLHYATISFENEILKTCN